MDILKLLLRLVNLMNFKDWLVGCKFKSNCPLVGPGIIGGMSSVGVFLRNPNPYLRELLCRKKS